MYSSGAHVFLFLLFLANQNSGGEAAPCTNLTRSDTLDIEISGTGYSCSVDNIPYCIGGCVAEVKYDLHVSDSSSPKRYCSAEVYQCVENGEKVVEWAASAYNCVYTIGGSQPASQPALWLTVPTNCVCNLIHGDDTSEDVCETPLSKLI